MCKTAANIGLAEQICKPERAKGTVPSTRAVCEKARDGSNDSIAVRRIKRLRRACIAEAAVKGNGAALTVVQKRHWRAFVHDKVVKCIRRTPSCQRAAMAALDKAFTELEERDTNSRIIDWKRTINKWGLEALRAGSRNIKPGIAPLASSASEMKTDWESLWCRKPNWSNHAQAWWNEAVDAGPSPSPTREWIPSSFERFLEAIMFTDGAAGFDGWCKEEVRAIVAFIHWIIEEIYVSLI